MSAEALIVNNQGKHSSESHARARLGERGGVERSKLEAILLPSRIG
jgi:hypothetical protein